MDNKPIIRHCRNCEYALVKLGGTIHCIVKYKYYEMETQRKTAIFCRHYKRKQPTPEFFE